MLRADVALVCGAEPASRTVANPFGIGPIGLEQDGVSCATRSALNDNKKVEVTLAVGDPA